MDFDRTGDPQIRGTWREMIDTMHELEEAKSESGFETIALHPGDVSVVVDQGNQDGIYITLPSDEYARLEKLREKSGEYEYRLYRQTEDENTFFILICEGSQNSVCWAVPFYYPTDNEQGLREMAAEHGGIEITLRTLNDDSVTFDIDIFRA